VCVWWGGNVELKVHSMLRRRVYCLRFFIFNKTLNVPHDTDILHGKQCEDLNHTWLQICYNMT